MKKITLLVSAMALSLSAVAKLPAPSEEAKAKAAEAAAKAAHGNKVAGYQLCKANEKAAAHYFKTAKASGKATAAPVDTPACVNPGAYVPAAAPTPAPKG